MDLFDIVTIYEIPDYEKLKEGVLESIRNIGGDRLDLPCGASVSNTNFYDDKLWQYDNRVHDVLENFFINYSQNGWVAKFGGQVWHQVYEKGDWHDWHTHSGTSMAGVWSVQCEDDQGTLIRIGNEIHQVPAKEGTIAVFPSGLLHRTQTQESENSRIVLAFNWDHSWDADWWNANGGKQ